MVSEIASNKHRPAATSCCFVQPRTLTILGTYRCTASCENCCFESGPNVKGQLNLEEIIRFIEEGSKLPHVKVAVFSGGECFLLGEDLTRAIEFANSKGLVTRCVTNGYWAASKEAGRRRLERLVAAGLDEINLSTGDFHQVYVKLNTIINALELSSELGIRRIVLMVELTNKREVTKAKLETNERLAKLISDGRLRIIESPWMPMDSTSTIDQPAGVMLNRSNIHLKRGCDTIFSTLVLTPKSQIGICCGLPREKIPDLNLEWAGESLEGILSRCGSDFLKIWLRVDGPEKILAWAATKDPAIDWENRYAHYCHACLALFERPEIRNTILKHYKERISDVMLRYQAILRYDALADFSSDNRDPGE